LPNSRRSIFRHGACGDATQAPSLLQISREPAPQFVVSASFAA
jgi:hypothetical protein